MKAKKVYEAFTLKGPSNETIRNLLSDEYYETLHHLENLYDKYGSWEEVPNNKRSKAKSLLSNLMSKAKIKGGSESISFPYGFKMMRLINFARQNPGSSWSDVHNFLVEISKGRPATVDDRGYWGTNLTKGNLDSRWGLRPGFMNKYLEKRNDGYYATKEGLKRMKYWADKYDYDLNKKEESNVDPLEWLQKTVGKYFND